jgi:ATP-dependent RNA helicase DeaD
MARYEPRDPTMTDEAAAPLPPPPTFDVLPLSPEVRKAVDELGYVHPTPVQRAVFETAVRGADMVVQARTGTGKTAAFGLPIVDSGVKKSANYVQAIVLSPTRELALQITRELDALAKYRGVRVTPVYGGAPMGPQVEAIQSGTQIVVGTPGRVLDHLRRGTLDPSKVRLFVLDESDEMLSMGFLPQITDVMSRLPESRQTLLFSATLPPDIQRVAETKLKNPEFVTLSGDHIGALEIDHYVYYSHGDKLADLVKVIEVENPESAIVFCNTRDDTRRASAALTQAGYDAAWLNAELSQADREAVMARTREGKLRFLVATDVAARGIDISHLTHVINYGFPESSEQYVHRTGRTGRAGRTGTAISLFEPSDIGALYYLRLTYKIRPIEKALPSQQELRTRTETDLVESFVSLYGRSSHREDLALARRLLTHPLSEQVIAGLIREHLGVRPDAPDEAAAARRAKAPRVVEVENENPDATSSRRERSPARRGRDAAPRDERPRDERPRDERPREPRPRAERSRGERMNRTRDAAPDQGPTPTRDATPDESSEALVSPASTAGEPAYDRPRRGRPRRAMSEDQPTDTTRDEPPRFDVAEIFVNVGRKDGARASDFYDVLANQAGVTIDDTDYVNVRTKNAFIGVRREVLERAVDALNGATIAGQTAIAEPSRSRP